MGSPLVIALIITYERTRLALATIRSVKEKIVYPNIGFHIADDGSRNGHVELLLQEIGPNYEVTITNSARGGVGRSMNFGTIECHKRADLILHLEDDWVLNEKLDIQPMVDLLMKDTSIGMVRLGLVTLDMQGTTISSNGHIWWRLNKGPPYTFNGHPSLRHKRFFEAYGPYREGLKPGETEVSMCWQFNNLTGPYVVIPPDIPRFQHIGDSQSFKYYLERENMTGEQAAALFAKMDALKGME